MLHSFSGVAKLFGLEIENLWMLLDVRGEISLFFPRFFLYTAKALSGFGPSTRATLESPQPRNRPQRQTFSRAWSPNG
jgi:hypothetical protein